MSTSPNGTDVQIATDPAFSTTVVNSQGAYRTSEVVSTTEFPYGVDLYLRVRHHHPETGISNWSPVVQFKVVLPSWVIGVCLDNTAAVGTFYWIDAAGNQLATFDSSANPIFQAIAPVSLDVSRNAVAMVKVPLFFVKTAVSGPVGTFSNGKKCWWMSNTSDNGFRPAACFKRTTQTDANGKYVISPFVYWATYLANTTTISSSTVLCSTSGVKPTGGQSKATYRQYAKNRNNVAAGMSGFRMFDIWDLGALRLLTLLLKAKADVQTYFGNNPSSDFAPLTGSQTGCSVKFNLNTPDPCHT